MDENTLLNELLFLATGQTSDEPVIPASPPVYPARPVEEGRWNPSGPPRPTRPIEFIGLEAAPPAVQAAIRRHCGGTASAGDMHSGVVSVWWSERDQGWRVTTSARDSYGVARYLESCQPLVFR